MVDVSLENIRELYTKKLNTKKPEGRQLHWGKESEYPLVFANGAKAGQPVLHNDWKRLLELVGTADGWRLNCNASGSPTGAEVTYVDPVTGGTTTSVIGTDFGVCTMEISYGAAPSLGEVQRQADYVLGTILEAAKELGIAILGYGIQPLAEPDRRLVANKGRALTLESRFSTQRMLNHGNTDVHFHTINAAEHIHVDITEELAIPYVNAMNKIAPYLNGLFANSNVWKGVADTTYLDPREKFWDWVVAIPRDKERKGIPREFVDFDDYISNLLACQPILTFRKSGDEIAMCEFTDVASYQEFLRNGGASVIAPGTRNDPRPVIIGGHELSYVVPDPIDLDIADGTLWHANRIKHGYGTVESRVAAQQPPEEAYAPLALIAGLRADAEELIRYVASKGMTNKEAKIDRELIIRQGLQAKTSHDPQSTLLDILAISEAGLRSIGEDTAVLDPLWQRARGGHTNAERMRDIFLQGGIKALIENTRYR